jgi:hypothetical protein
MQHREFNIEPLDKTAGINEVSRWARFKSR